MKVNAMVIDDSRVMRKIVMESLRETGLAEFEFVEAEDGADALKKFRPKKTDIIFVDWNMPNMTGYDFVCRVRAMDGTSHIPLVMVTSERTVGKMSDALDHAGATDYITKPFKADDLRKRLKTVFDGIAAKQSEGGGGFFGRLLGG
jgi:two-component system chemotaxis response regulator CheY